jgi:hypothetical protein
MPKRPASGNHFWKWQALRVQAIENLLACGFSLVAANEMSRDIVNGNLVAARCTLRSKASMLDYGISLASRNAISNGGHA